MKVVIYARVSTDDQSPANQIDALREVGGRAILELGHVLVNGPKSASAGCPQSAQMPTGGEWRARSQKCHNRKSVRYSITSSARARIDGGMVRPSALAVLRLITKSNLVGCSTGMSAGFAPRRIFAANVAARRKISGRFAA
jgi:hypothetical protein